MWRPQDGHVRFRCFNSSALFFSPATVIIQPIPSVVTTRVAAWGSNFIVTPNRLRLFPSVGVRSEVQLTAPPIGYVRIELRRRQIGVSKHLLNRTEVGSALEQMGREGVAEQVWMNTFRLEAGVLGELAQDEERAGARERAALRVQEELGPVSLVEKRA